MRQADVLVIGGGILGCAAAYYLTRRGVSVVLVDKGPLAAESTGATTGGITLQNRSPERLPFYQAAAEYWPALGDELGADLGYTQCGSLIVASTPEDLARLTDETHALQPLGLEIELLTSAEARALEPCLAADIVGASYCPVDGFAEPDRPSQAFAAAAERQGATFLPHHPVEALQRHGQGFRASTPSGEISANLVVNAAGAWAGQIAAMLGVTLPISLDPLHALAMEARPAWLNKVIWHVNRKLTLKQLRDGRLMIGGGWPARGDLAGGPRTVVPENQAANLQLASQVVPQVAELKIEQVWIGLEGRSPDRLPFFGEVEAVPGFYMLACVHGGFTMATLLGDQLAELIVDGRTSFPMRDFTCQAFLEEIGRKV